MQGFMLITALSCILEDYKQYHSPQCTCPACSVGASGHPPQRQSWGRQGEAHRHLGLVLGDHKVVCAQALPRLLLLLGRCADHRHLHAKACAWRRAPESLPGRAAQPEHLTQSADSSQQATESLFHKKVCPDAPLPYPAFSTGLSMAAVDAPRQL